MHGDDLSRRLDRLRRMMAAQQGGRDASLADHLARVGRDLPRRLRHKAAVLARAEQMLAHPHLTWLVRRDEVIAAASDLERWLRGGGPARRRALRRLDTLGSVVFNLTVLALLVLAVLRWRGLM